MSEDFIETARELPLVPDADLRVRSASRSICVSFKVTAKQTLGKLIRDPGNRQGDIPEPRTLLEEVLPKDKEKALMAGFDEYVAKPIDTRKFPELVKQVLSRMRP